MANRVFHVSIGARQQPHLTDALQNLGSLEQVALEIDGGGGLSPGSGYGSGGGFGSGNLTA